MPTPNKPATSHEGSVRQSGHLSGQMEEIKAIFGDMYEPYLTTTEYEVLDYMRTFERDNTPPPSVHPWECRIGLTKMIVPPLNINVSQVFRAGAVSSALRQQNSPKFNSGHSETMISMTLYFPTHESIWGFSGDRAEIDFETAPDYVIDTFASSLRGLISQFKYAPFLPIKCQYINQAYGITGVTMHSMSVSTVEGFPFCLAVQLDMLNFNHKVYLPMISDFDQAIHWGKFRQYIGRASAKLSQIATKGFLAYTNKSDYEDITAQKNEDSLLARFRKTLPDYYDKQRVTRFSMLDEWHDGKNFDIFYPAHTPVAIVYPDLTDFRDPNASPSMQKKRNWWQTILNELGFPYAPGDESEYEKANQYWDGNYGDNYLKEDKRLLSEWLRANQYTTKEMTSDLLDEYVAQKTKEFAGSGTKPSVNVLDEFGTKLRDSWFALVYESFITNDYMANVLEVQEQERGTFVKEWDVPMRRLNLDPKYVIVDGVSVSMGNNYARLQLQLQDEPVHQHIGGLDTRCDISLTIFGETELAKFRTLWTHINGLARLTQGRGVLGFIGFKNVVTALCGMKYAMPESFEVDTVPNYPHVYNVRLSFIDFDVFQQKREMLSSEQQSEFIDAFTKRNPFLRIKQRWSAFNAYPDFPLTVRDDEGKIIGNLDPDFYFKSFRTFDDDVADVDDGFSSPVNHVISMAGDPKGKGGSGSSDVLQVDKDGLSLGGKVMPWWEANADQVRVSSHIPGLTPLGNYQNPYKDHSGNPIGAYKHILQDTKFRDNGGRMVRAFPTYMLWLIDEGGIFSGVKLFDNFYGLQSVIDIAVGTSEDSIADTLILQISNLYSRLSTPYRNEIDETIYDKAHIINTQNNRNRNLASGLTDYLINIDTVELKPGVRVHLRMGYSADPNALETVFNGVITNVENGEIITVTAQSDTVELSAIVNNSNESGDTGKMDGSLFGMWISEPRDLMIRLLTMGASKTKEAMAHAQRGRVFSENRWGIRHFGTMMYPPMTDRERALVLHKGNTIDGAIKSIMGGGLTSILGGPAGIFNFGLFDVFSSFSSSFFRKRDYEIFKRNIYPGNGTGISQYQGGDMGDAGMALGLSGVATGINPEEEQKSAAEITGTAPVGGQQTGKLQPLARNVAGFADIPGVHDQPHPFMTALGLSQQDKDDDVKGADEVSFRANTYMKSVWDLFQTCAALLPNYIVAVRPFEERSTIFYGKPHWLYTSGVIPLTTGVDPTKLGIEDPDEEMLTLMDTAREKMREEKESDEEFYSRLSQNVSADPGTSTAGMVWDGRKIEELPLSSPGIASSKPAIIPLRKTGVGMEMHLPTSGDLAQDIKQHKQEGLPAELSHPYYMDRSQTGTAKGPQGGVGGAQGEAGKWNDYSKNGTKMKLDNPTWPGRTGAFGVLDPNVEQWYMNMRWPYRNEEGNKSSQKSYLDGAKSKKIMVYNTRTKKGCICAPAEWGPGKGPLSQGIGAGVSPDVGIAIDLKRGDECYFGFVEDSAPLGPVTGIDGSVPKQSAASKRNDVVSTVEAVGIDYLGDMKAAGYKDLRKYAYDKGWTKNHFPINYTDEKAGVIDELGLKAKEVYDQWVDDGDAQTIWNEFRMDFRSEPDTKPIFKKLFPNQPDKIYNLVVDEFIKYMWQNGYHRGWVVKVTDAEWSVGGIVTGDVAVLGDFLGRAPGVFGTVGDAISGSMKAVGSAVDGVLDVATNPLENAGDLLTGNGGSGNKYNFHNVRKLFEVWLIDPSKAKEFMLSNSSPGKSQRGLFGRAVEEFYTGVWQDMWSVLKSITTAIASVATGVLSMMRFALLSLGQGISQATFNQAIANSMNRAFNDSIYFQAGPPGTLAFLADNPFTREYGEPVVEIRQPFQRVHLVNSFRNIISNGIRENFEGVATVVTATTGGKHPQTVHLDKALPAEKQVERTVETGILWDSGGPEGGIPLVKNILHPVETLRGWQTNYNNGDSETSAKRVALWHLKEGLKDIYGGDLVILGDPGIRPFDLIYLGDVQERMYGLCEVEQVVHHFNAEMGFVTSITPNALVSVNDPARWSMLSFVRARLNTWNLRNDLRTMYASPSALSSLPKNIELQNLARTVSPQLLGALEFTGGNTALAKDVAAMSFTGQLGAGDIGPQSGSARGAVLGGLQDWGPWNYIKQNLLDQQSCYIQFLTKDGRAMDAGLYENRGIAVGQQRTATIFKNTLRLELPFSNSAGNSTIATNDVLGAIGWTELQMGDLIQGLDLASNETKAEVLGMAGRMDDGTDSGEFYTFYVTVTSVIDPDTIHFSPKVLGKDTLRFAAIDAPEVAHKNLGIDPPPDLPEEEKVGYSNESDLLRAEELSPNDPGVRAWRFTFDRLSGQKIAIRISKKEPTEKYGRLLGFVFYNAPADMAPAERQELLMGQAGNMPPVPWDGYASNGMPYTLNWELVATGNANVYLYLHEKNLPNQGADGSFSGASPGDQANE